MVAVPVVITAYTQPSPCCWTAADLRSPTRGKYFATAPSLADPVMPWQGVQYSRYSARPLAMSASADDNGFATASPSARLVGPRSPRGATPSASAARPALLRAK